ncbi:MAG: hypothetical protein IPJ19_09065 [Planctomycetes bacterium]|nr:hypothetical protein [Planctomycetota bacterium]
MSRATSQGRATRPYSRAELEDELGRVHAREFARLLCLAASIRLRFEHPQAKLPDAWMHALKPQRWREQARRARELAEVDGYELEGLLRRALARPVAEWSDAAELVRAASALDGSEATRWHCAALAWVERRAGAREALAAFASGARCESWRARALGLLGACTEDLPPW